MALQTKRFGWVRTLSAWEQHQAWQERRKAMREEFETNATAASNAFATAWTNQISGAANLAGQAALKRIQAATAAKLDKTA